MISEKVRFTFSGGSIFSGGSWNIYKYISQSIAPVVSITHIPLLGFFIRNVSFPEFILANPRCLHISISELVLNLRYMSDDSFFNYDNVFEIILVRRSS